MGLGNRMFKAAAWLYGLRLVTSILGLVSFVILARLLVPSDFGLVSIAMLIIGALEVFTRSGLQHSVVQKTEVSRPELYAIWSFDVVRGVLLGVIMFLSAPYIGAFMNSPGSVPVIRVMSVIPLLLFLPNIDMTLIWKELETKKMFCVEAAGLVTSVVVGISFALLYRNVWALVASVLTNHLVRVLASYLVSPSCPRFVWDWSVVKYHLGYGRQIMINGIGYYLFTNLDGWFVGKVMGESALGFYRKAYTLGNLPATELANVLARVSFPSFSKLKDDRQRLGCAFLRVQQMLALVMMPISAMLFFFAAPLVHVLLGEKWMPMIPAFQILVLWGSLRAQRAAAGSALRAVGRPVLEAYTIFAKLALLVVLLWPARHYGIAGVAGVVLFAALLEFPVLMWLSARQLDIAPVAIYRPMILPSIVAACAAGTSFLLSHGSSEIMRLFWGVFGTTMGYLAVMIAVECLFHPDQFTDVRRTWQLAYIKLGVLLKHREREIVDEE